MAALHSAPLRLGVRPPAAVAGWAAQDAFAATGLPVFWGLFAATAVAYGVRGWVSGRAPAA
ncbi:hypothetical protein ACIBCU_32150 [Streptomyces sp. NPDC051064]|uniref:hypothetical protein n=1 Tax=Streptomyces sp. NPDC051064 TaxID=3365641 RepID=UPI0037BB59D3